MQKQVFIGKYANLKLFNITFATDAGCICTQGLQEMVEVDAKSRERKYSAILYKAL